jgi:predicted DNA-binding transcriptional regulator YafY
MSAPIASPAFSIAPCRARASRDPPISISEAYWRNATERLEAEMHPREATVRLSPLGIRLLEALTQPYVKARLRIADDADANGWRTATIPIGTTDWHAAAELLRLGPEAEVLAPQALRARMTELTQTMAERYRASAHSN